MSLTGNPNCRETGLSEDFIIQVGPYIALYIWTLVWIHNGNRRAHGATNVNSLTVMWVITVIASCLWAYVSRDPYRIITGLGFIGGSGAFAYFFGEFLSTPPPKEEPRQEPPPKQKPRQEPPPKQEPRQEPQKKEIPIMDILK